MKPERASMCSVTSFAAAASAPPARESAIRNSLRQLVIVQRGDEARRGWYPRGGEGPFRGDGPRTRRKLAAGDEQGPPLAKRLNPNVDLRSGVSARIGEVETPRLRLVEGCRRAADGPSCLRIRRRPTRYAPEPPSSSLWKALGGGKRGTGLGSMAHITSQDRPARGSFPDGDCTYKA